MTTTTVRLAVFHIAVLAFTTDILAQSQPTSRPMQVYSEEELSKFSAETLRTIAARLYKRVSDLEAQVKSQSEEIQKLQKENASLKVLAARQPAAAAPEESSPRPRPTAKNSPVAGDQPAHPPKFGWAVVDCQQQLGDIQVEVIHPIFDEVGLTSMGRDSKSKDRLLQLGVIVSNLNGTTKADYSTWRGKDFAIDRDYATLTDNFGNSYKRVSFGLTSKIRMSTDADSIYPFKSVTDVLVFELPIDSATEMSLELPGKNVGQAGKLVYKFIKVD